MWLGLLMGIRLGLLSGERTVFHQLGKGVNPLSTMLLAYGGAALMLWAAAWPVGQLRWEPASMASALIYAASFGCYTVSLTKGPVSTVSAWSNAVVIMIFLLQPVPSVLAWLGVGVFGMGMWMLLTVGDRVLSSGVIWMLLADLFLVVGRFWDAGHGGVVPLSYAASLMTGVTVVMGLCYLLFLPLPSVMTVLKARWTWALLAAGFNAGSYLTLVVLIGALSPFVVEAVSSMAGVGATLLGVFFLGESSNGRRKIEAAALMTLGAIGVLSDHLGWITLQW